MTEPNLIRSRPVDRRRAAALLLAAVHQDAPGGGAVIHAVSDDPRGTEHAIVALFAATGDVFADVVDHLAPPVQAAVLALLDTLTATEADRG